MVTRKKLIEVALPLEAINKASAREKSIRHGHPSTLHLWWARRPLAAARAVIFAQMVDDPSSYPELFPTEKAQEKERKRLFKIIEELVQWENTTNEKLLQQAREEIWASWRRACNENVDHPRAAELFDRYKLPAFHDPFAGGGALPLEAQRLGMESYASDLNPVAVLINKAMIEIPPMFAGTPPVNPGWHQKPEQEKMGVHWKGASGLADDIRYYGNWMRDEAEKRIGHLYPKVAVTAEMAKERPDLKPYVGRLLTVIAWIWARTVKSPNPAFADVDVPLASTFLLSSKAGKEVYIEPIIAAKTYSFKVRVGKPKNYELIKKGTSAGKRKAFSCLMSGVPIPYDYIRSEGISGRIGSTLLAGVVESDKGRLYLPPTDQIAEVAGKAKPKWKPDADMPKKHRNFQPPVYGMNTLGDIFTSRQLVALSTFSDLVSEAMQTIRADAVKAGIPDDPTPLRDGGKGAVAYAEAVAVYLALAVDRSANTLCTIARWTPDRNQTVTAFARQAIPMTWDYPDVNPFSGAAGDYSVSIEGVIKGMAGFTNIFGKALQEDACVQLTSAVSN